MLSGVRQPKKPWPTKAAMEQVYEKNLWGGRRGEFYSGFGSHELEFVGPYVEVVSRFLKSFDQPITVCDLGCGDFNVGRELVKYSEKYIAVDIAENLIRRNKAIFWDEKLEFHCLDISKDELPSGDCAILRHVLQHVSNDEVHHILKKLSEFKYVIISDHIPHDEFIPNLDIISGQATRLKKKSGLNVLADPFKFEVKNSIELLVQTDQNGKIVTTKYTMF